MRTFRTVLVFLMVSFHSPFLHSQDLPVGVENDEDRLNDSLREKSELAPPILDLLLRAQEKEEPELKFGDGSEEKLLWDVGPKGLSPDEEQKLFQQTVEAFVKVKVAVIRIELEEEMWQEIARMKRELRSEGDNVVTNSITNEVIVTRVERQHPGFLQLVVILIVSAVLLIVGSVQFYEAFDICREIWKFRAKLEREWLTRRTGLLFWHLTPGVAAVFCALVLGSLFFL